MLEKLLEQLLFDHECVILPGFGAFITQDRKAIVSNGYLYPKTKVLAFNATLKSNDGLLINYLSEEKDIPYTEAKRLVEKKVSEYQLDLEEKGRTYIKNLGTISYNEEQKLIFQPEEEINFEKESFGFKKIKIEESGRRRSSLKESYIKSRPHDKSRRTSRNRRILLYSLTAYAPLIIIFWVFVLSKQELSENNQAGIQFFNQEQGLNPVEVEESEPVVVEIQENKDENVIAEKESMTRPEVSMDKERLHYHVIGGAFRNYDNAVSLLNELKRESYVPKLIKKNNLHLVSYKSFANRGGALSFLRDIQQKVNSKAWIYYY